MVRGDWIKRRLENLAYKNGKQYLSEIGLSGNHMTNKIS